MERGKPGCGSPDVTEISGTRGVCKWERAIRKPDPARFATTRRWYLGGGDLERGRWAGSGLFGRLVTLCGRMGRGRVMVVSSGEDERDTVEECLRRIVAVESAEELLRVKEVLRGKGGRFGVEGVVGVSIGDCCWSCIFNTAFVFSYTDECSGDLI